MTEDEAVAELATCLHISDEQARELLEHVASMDWNEVAL